MRPETRLLGALHGHKRPRGAWERHHPAAKAIALELLAHRPILNLRSGLLVGDVRTRFNVGGCTARTAVAMAKRNARGAS